jgi:hypothetical protein
MLYALRAALTLVVLLFVLQIFVPDVAAGLVQIALRLIEITLMILNHAPSEIPTFTL